VYLIFPWVYRSPWCVGLFALAYLLCLFPGGEAAAELSLSVVPALIVGGGMLIAAGISYAGMTAAANRQAEAAKKAAAAQRRAARAAANTPMARMRREMALAAGKRLDDDNYVGLSAAQKREVMRSALTGYDAMTRGVEVSMRRHIGAAGFGSSGAITEALSDIQSNKTDVAAKTASSAEQIDAQKEYQAKSTDRNIVAGTPDTQAASLMQIGAAKANEAVQMGNIGATEVAGKSALAAQTLTGLATYSPSVYTTPWYQQAWEEGQEAQAAKVQAATAAWDARQRVQGQWELPDLATPTGTPINYTP